MWQAQAVDPYTLTFLPCRHCARPLAGTRRRGRSPEEDAALEADLLADEKERAEHIMLLDLGRNDVGRVSVAGSVKARPACKSVCCYVCAAAHVVPVQ